MYRSSRSQMFHKICVLKRFAKFTGKWLYGNLLIKLQGWGLQIYLERDSDTGVSCEFEISLVLFKMSLFNAAHKWVGSGQKGPVTKICHTYPTMRKPSTVICYLKRIQKVCGNFAISRITDIDYILIHNF